MLVKTHRYSPGITVLKRVMTSLLGYVRKLILGGENSTPRWKSSDVLLDNIFSSLVFNFNKDHWTRSFPILAVGTSMYWWYPALLLNILPKALAWSKGAAKVLDLIGSMWLSPLGNIIILSGSRRIYGEWNKTWDVWSIADVQLRTNSAKHRLKLLLRPTSWW